MSGRLDGKVVVVTGATGIAAAGARRFAAEGAVPFVVSLEASDCLALAQEIGAGGGRCEWMAADLRQEQAAVEAVRQCQVKLGPINGLFAVAGGSGRPFGDGPVHDVALDGWIRTFELNGHPMFLAVRESVRSMRVESGGSIVIVSSVLAGHPSPKLFATHAYAAAKGAAVSFARATAAFYAPNRIRVNVICPGLVSTPMSARAASDPVTVAYVTEKQPLAAGFLPPEAIANAALFLISDESQYVTGQVLEVDGGWSVTEAGAPVV